MIKKIYSFLPFFFLVSQLSAQTKLEELFKNANIFYLDSRELPATEKDSVAFIRVIQRDSSDKQLFTVQDFYLSGSRRLVGKSILPSYYLRREGVFMEYYRNGRRKSVKTYENDVEKGDEMYYYPNGKPYYTRHFDSGAKQWIVSESADSTGAVLATDGKGSYIIYNHDFKLVKGKGPLLNGLKDGEWRGNVNDTTTYVCTYNKGVCSSGVSTSSSGRKYEFKKDIDEPEFPGGEQNFGRFLARTMRYPAVAKENNIQGKVFISFIVNKDGTLSGFNIVRGIGSGCDDEVLRVLRLSPPWRPGFQYGIAMNFPYTIPISFTLQQDIR